MGNGVQQKRLCQLPMAATNGALSTWAAAKWLCALSSNPLFSCTLVSRPQRSFPHPYQSSLLQHPAGPGWELLLSKQTHLYSKYWMCLVLSSLKTPIQVSDFTYVNDLIPEKDKNKNPNYVHVTKQMHASLQNWGLSFQFLLKEKKTPGHWGRHQDWSTA